MSIFDNGPAAPPEKAIKIKRSKKREVEALSPLDLAQGKRRLADMVEMAFNTLEEAATHADHNTAIKAAQIILDRAGFGPKSSLDVTNLNFDLSALSREELADRASQLAKKLREGREPKQISDTIDTTATVN